MAGNAESATDRVQAAAARTSGAGSARLGFGSSRGSPVAGELDWAGEGVADFAGRRALVSQQLMPASMQEDFTQQVRDDQALEGVQPMLDAFGRLREVLYDGANQLLRSSDGWLAFTREVDDRDGPRSHEDPLWPLDALFGANPDVTELDEQSVRDVPTVHYRLTVDLGAADAAVPEGVRVPEGPYGRLRRWPTEVWLDAAGLARRIAVAKTSNPAGRWTVTDFWNFGVTVTIAVPDPSQITTLDEPNWLQALLSGNEAQPPTEPT